MCRPYCTTPDYRSLPKGNLGLPVIHGLPMTEEEYRVTGWHSRGTYVTGKGTTEHLWIAPMGGHILWAQRTWQEREQRISAAQTRRQRDDEYSDSITSMVEEKR